MRGLAGALPVHARHSRRRALATATAALASATASCAPPAGPSAGDTGEIYVALARHRAIALLDPATDREVGRISLDSLGRASHPWRLGVSPS
ncbi:MAG TPA: hypothetical protein VFX49_04330, partial [Chloroflexota bacterium]|nr:hypothetical protein [Chloroflexota bacterium]